MLPGKLLICVLINQTFSPPQISSHRPQGGGAKVKTENTSDSQRDSLSPFKYSLDVLQLETLCVFGQPVALSGKRLRAALYQEWGT